MIGFKVSRSEDKTQFSKDSLLWKVLISGHTICSFLAVPVLIFGLQLIVHPAST